MIRREFGTWCLNSSTEAAKRRPRVMPVVAGRLAPWLELWLAPQQRCVRPAGVSAGASNRQKARYIGSQNMSAGLRIRLAQQEPAERTTRGPRRQQNMPTAARARQPCAAVEPPRSLASPVSPHPPIGTLGGYRHGGPVRCSHGRRHDYNRTNPVIRSVGHRSYNPHIRTGRARKSEK